MTNDNTLVYASVVDIDGFDWDGGNWPKCGKHGVSREEIEYVLLGEPHVLADPRNGEAQMLAIGKNEAGRYVFLVFVQRENNGLSKLRPISARYMHQDEIDYYESQENKTDSSVAH